MKNFVGVLILSVPFVYYDYESIYYRYIESQDNYWLQKNLYATEIRANELSILYIVFNGIL